MNTDVQKVESALVEFDKVSAGLAALKERYGSLVFDCRVPKQMDEAKAARAAIREPRYEVERIRKDAKAPLLALGRKLDGDAKRIVDELLVIEGPIQAQIEAEETRKETERQAKVQAEQQRVADIQIRIAVMRGTVADGLHATAALIIKSIAELDAVAIDDSFMEFRQQAEDAKGATLAKLRDMHSAAVQREEAAAKAEAERQEREARLKAEEERQAAERTRLAEEEKAAQARRSAQEASDRQAREAEDRKAREALAQARKQQEAELAARKEAQDAQDRERAAEDKWLSERKAELQREQEANAEAKRQQEEAARRASVKRPPASEIVDVLAKHYDVDRERVIVWLHELVDLELAA